MQNKLFLNSESHWLEKEEEENWKNNNYTHHNFYNRHNHSTLETLYPMQ